ITTRALGWVQAAQKSSPGRSFSASRLFALCLWLLPIRPNCDCSHRLSFRSSSILTTGTSDLGLGGGHGTETHSCEVIRKRHDKARAGTDHCHRLARRRPRALSMNVKLQATVREAPAVAVVGLSSLLPGSGTTAGFWRDILEGRDRLTEVPRTHWLPADY